MWRHAKQYYGLTRPLEKRLWKVDRKQGEGTEYDDSYGRSAQQHYGKL